MSFVVNAMATIRNYERVIHKYERLENDRVLESVRMCVHEMGRMLSN